MNAKEKFEAAKRKAKHYSPEIAIFAAAAATLTIGIIAAKKQIGIFAPFEEVDAAAREKLMSDKSFSLFKLSETEYMLSQPE